MLLRDQSSDNSLKPNYSGDYVILNDLLQLKLKHILEKRQALVTFTWKMPERIHFSTVLCNVRHG